jgi:hypothetical protein
MTIKISPPGGESQGAQDNSGAGSVSAPNVRDTGLEQAIEAAASDWWTTCALLAIKQLALTGRGFTVDHVLDMCGQPEDPHYVGAVFALAQCQRIVEAVGARVGHDNRLRRIWWGLPT